MTLSLDDILAPGGLISRRMPNYEPRPQQLDMARAVAEAFDAGQDLVVEAGTGVGKSFAYLVPAILGAVGHKPKRRVVVSTYTIALQEQLITKDLPFLHDVLPMEFSAVLGKGRQNYICFRRMGMAIKGRDKLFWQFDQQEQLVRLSEWAMETDAGSLQDITFPLDRGVWEKVRSDPGSCLAGKCPFHGKCHLQAARRRMLGADILVVNHALFFSDLALKASQTSQARLLGDYDLAILDEAHTVEQVAGDHFGCSVSNSTVEYLLRDLYNDQTDRGILAMLGEADAIDAVNRAANACEGFFAALAEYRGPGITPNGRIRQPGLISNELSPALSEVARLLKDARKRIDDEDRRFEIVGCEQRALELAHDIQRLIALAEESHVYWLTIHQRGRRPIVTLASAPIDVSPILRTLLFDSVSSAVLTSATLATSRGGENGFEYLRRRLGIDECRELLLDSPFDYRRQAKLYVETQLGDPNDLASFTPAACKAISYYVEKTRGRCFVLFTSYRMLEAAAELLGPWCQRHEYKMFVQGWGLSRGGMLDQFRSHPRAVLLGTTSFWQGVDVAGEALSNVIIVKLPFAVPDDPITEARIDMIHQQGGNPFGQYQLPEAIIRFKQGFGRLIRSTTDTGIVVVLDHRIATKGYGRQFIAALPELEVVRDEFSGEEGPRS
jgi:ATP-dependent DNA helicase DinG